MIVNISLKGNLVNESSRYSISPYLVCHVILGITQLICAIFGLTIFAQHTDIPCYNDVIDDRIITALLLVTTVTQIFDITLLTCCFGFIYRWKKVEYMNIKSRHSFIDLRNRFQVPQKSELKITYDDRSTYQKNAASAAKSFCKCLQISSCNLFGGGNVGEDITVRLLHTALDYVLYTQYINIFRIYY
jgi:hypothetical protein